MNATREYPPLIAALLNPAMYPHPVKTVAILETHISWVVLAGRYAYKIKKPVDFGFLNFTDLAQREFFCLEELRLNRRLAKSLYLDVVTLGGTPGHPGFGLSPTVEYAVKMRRFGAGRLLDELLNQNRLTPTHIDHLADIIAQFHDGLPPAPATSAFGTPDAVAGPARQNFQQLAETAAGRKFADLTQLAAASAAEFAADADIWPRRRQAGRIRECHGDLHLGNIVLLRDRPVAFDGIEFAPELRWIDTINDSAFLVMDLLHRGRADLAYRFLNRYLETGGDYAGLAVLRFYLSYRATVRAKIAAFRAEPSGDPIHQSECHAYLKLAEASLRRRRPVLLITHGPPGCGKTAISQLLLEGFGLIRLRSDVERKRLFGLSPTQASGSGLDAGLYAAEAGRQTYVKLADTAGALLRLGYPVIVDAAFLKLEQRRAFRDLAAELDAAFMIVAVTAETSLARSRIERRLTTGGDASEADPTVLAHLSASAEALTDTELEHTLVCRNDTTPPQLPETLSARLRTLLNPEATQP
ncbi:AAA family ATPase [Methylomonas sp. MED-D]|uniref:bifunctional aminoglycoside phosphotransferase/ATP-binding protein n=1 Tax=unclassified Methylomonas TaxID=2608980 RepID=UPI0028A2FAAF|nr:AAA family ATPase [Methylomonas sp. MV1]MDT4332167.1 AAA family ATPase [Methylomonas sp. MV1]